VQDVLGIVGSNVNQNIHKFLSTAYANNPLSYLEYPQKNKITQSKQTKKNKKQKQKKQNKKKQTNKKTKQNKQKNK
jgi:hypothetical protein